LITIGWGSCQPGIADIIFLGARVMGWGVKTLMSLSTNPGPSTEVGSNFLSTGEILFKEGALGLGQATSQLGTFLDALTSSRAVGWKDGF